MRPKRAAESEYEMPVHIEYTQDAKGVVLHHEGRVTGEELIDAVTRVHRDSRFRMLKYWIGDRTNCTYFMPDKKCQETIATLNIKQASLNPNILLALVSPGDYEYGMSRMYKVVAEQAFAKIEIFRDRNSAKRWIEKELGSSS